MSEDKKKSKKTAMVLTGKVKVWVHSSSSPICLENIHATYQKGDMFCIQFATGRIEKYPMINIFRVIEDWELEEIKY